ncbi:MAG TPA: hypothetical protein VMI30_14455 [Stellaceae bacterium]|nr:hypothetical protein [Stellaceae bacterium]
MIDAWADDISGFEICMGAMTAMAIFVDLTCKSGHIDRDILIDQLSTAQDVAKGKRRIPLAMLQLILELLDSAPTTIL